MKSYQDILKLLNLPTSIIRCAVGAIKSPLVTFDAPAAWYGFPPALIPIWSDGSGPTYLGYWKHWFVNRKPCFVKMYVDANRLAIEIARTADQFLCVASMMSICEKDGVDSDLVRFAKEVGIYNLDQINDISLKTGDDPKGFLEIDQFKQSAPLESVSNLINYEGHFPTGNFDDPRAWWADSCSFEIPQKAINNWPGNIARPMWLFKEKGGLIDLFRGYLYAGNLTSAWLTLNSTGWLIKDAKLAISELSFAAKNEQFSALAEAWLSIADENAGGY